MAANERVAAPLIRLRWTLLGVVLILAIVAGILYRTTLGQSATPTTAVTLSDGPAAKWPAGALRAPELRLTDQNGAPVSLAALRGRPVLVTFIDPLCRNYCPIEAQRLNGVVRAFPRSSKPVIVAVSVNIYGNAHSILMQDVRKWKLVPEWRWAIGRPAALSRVWNAYHVEVLTQTKTLAGVTVHTIAHTEGAYLIDAKGFQRALFLWPYRAAGVVQTLRTFTP
jgi:cytochrome oxidase Cu insertion factor (SCO1/SenC/PrrC family)